MKFSLTLLLCFFVSFTSCSSQPSTYSELKQFTWIKGPEPQNEYRYNIALSKEGKVFVVGGDNDGSFEVFDTKDGHWSSLDPLPTPRSFLSGAMLHHSLYTIGGIDQSNQYSFVVEKYELTKNKWMSCQNLSVKRCRLASVSYNGKLYAIGGLEGVDDKDFRTSTIVEQYDPQTDSWIRKADMPTPRHGHSAAVIQDRIIVIGGYTDEGPTNVVEAYDPHADQWETKAKMPTARGFFGLINIDNYLYAIAGRVPLGKGPVERYDLKNDVWIQMDPIPEWRNRFGTTAANHKVYLIGGEDHPKSMLIGVLE